MANRVTLRWAFLVILAVTCMVQVQYAGGEGSLRPEQCGSACDYRCSATHNKGACLKCCNICCNKCLCVPSGIYGHKDECPCYRDWMSSKGTSKCP